jgi:hypothetical protein
MFVLIIARVDDWRVTVHGNLAEAKEEILDHTRRQWSAEMEEQLGKPPRHPNDASTFSKTATARSSGCSRPTACWGLAKKSSPSMNPPTTQLEHRT